MKPPIRLIALVSLLGACAPGTYHRVLVTDNIHRDATPESVRAWFAAHRKEWCPVVVKDDLSVQAYRICGDMTVSTMINFDGRYLRSIHVDVYVPGYHPDDLDPQGSLGPRRVFRALKSELEYRYGIPETGRRGELWWRTRGEAIVLIPYGVWIKELHMFSTPGHLHRPVPTPGFSALREAEGGSVSSSPRR